MKADVIKEQRTRTRRDVNLVVLAMLAYIGLAIPLQRWLDLRVLRWPATLVLGSIVALFGWARMKLTPSMKRYLIAALVFSLWLTLSTVVAWTGLAFYLTRLLIVWVLFIVPGIAVWMRSSSARHALIGGLVVGVGILTSVAAERVLRGLPATDFAEGVAHNPTLLDINRNVASVIVLCVLPFAFFARRPSKLARARLPLIAVSLVWLVFSGGRLALVGIVFFFIVYALTRPGGSGKMRSVYGGVLLALVIAAGVQFFGGPTLISTERISQSLHGTESAGDESRRLLLKKAWDLANEHPWFGIGFGAFEGMDDSAVQEGSTFAVQQHVLNAEEHNQYAQMMSEAGFPALFLFVLMVVQVLRAARGKMHDIEVRAAFCAMAILAFTMFFELVTDQTLGLVFALALGTAVTLESASAHDQQTPRWLDTSSPLRA